MAISVADTGTGISAAARPRIFEPCFSTRGDRGGQGLGLSIVRDIVRRCGGFLTVESVERRGTVFEIYLPRREPLAAPAQAKGVVLLVEDDPLVRRVAERCLQGAGWGVHAVESAEAALEMSLHDVFDLVIADVTLPGMDGVALAAAVLARCPAMPVILTSGYDAAARTIDERVSFLSKPYDREALLAAAARRLGARI